MNQDREFEEISNSFAQINNLFTTQNRYGSQRTFFILWSIQVLNLLLMDIILNKQINVQKRETQDYKAYPVSDSTVFLNWVSLTTFVSFPLLNFVKLWI